MSKIIVKNCHGAQIYCKLFSAHYCLYTIIPRVVSLLYVIFAFIIFIIKSLKHVKSQKYVIFTHELCAIITKSDKIFFFTISNKGYDKH